MPLANDPQSPAKREADFRQCGHKSELPVKDVEQLRFKLARASQCLLKTYLDLEHQPCTARDFAASAAVTVCRMFSTFNSNRLEYAYSRETEGSSACAFHQGTCYDLVNTAGHEIGVTLLTRGDLGPNPTEERISQAQSQRVHKITLMTWPAPSVKSKGLDTSRHVREHARYT